MRVQLLLLAGIICLAAFCSIAFAQSPIKYSPTLENIRNPERGLMLYGGEAVDHSGGCWWNSPPRFAQFVKDMETGLDERQLSLVYLQYDLGHYRKSKLEEPLFKCLTEDFAAVRKSGYKVVLRFSYNQRKKPGGAEYDIFPEDDKVPNPYEASIADILMHLNDQKFADVIGTNSDVIAVWQAGFLGKFGEWFYTSTDAGLAGKPKMGERVKIIRRMLEILPSPGIIQVRNPYYKVYSLAEMPPGEAQLYADRIGIFNDSFHHKDDPPYDGESGTFESYNNAKETADDWRAYLVKDSKKAPVGGETSSPVKDQYPKSEADLEPILKDFARYHWTFFNEAKVSRALATMDWTPLRLKDSQDRLRTKLGYRLMLVQAVFTETIKAGQPLKVTLLLENAGWASPYQRRNVEFFLCRKNVVCHDPQKGFTLLPNQDLRDWLPQSERPAGITLEANIPTTGLAPGEYDVYLNLPDSSTSLKDNPAYSIRLANAPHATKDNKPLADAFRFTEKGYNRFGSVTIQ